MTCWTTVAVYIAVHVITYIVIIHVLAKAHLKNKDNKVLRERFYPFFRNDLDNWSIVTLFPFYITFWPRLLLGVLNLVVFGIVV